MNEIPGRGEPKLPHAALADEILNNVTSPPDFQGGFPDGTEKIYAFADQMRRDERKDREKETDEELETWVTFSLAGEFFALPVSNVREILRAGTITQVPRAPHSVRGVTNMRGKVLPVVDLKARLGLQESKIDQLHRILVTETCERLIGLLVDSVQHVMRLDIKTMQPPPPDVMTGQSDCILGVYHLQDSLVILLDVDKVLFIRDSLQNEALAGAK